MNRLADSTSPYLLQHTDNPVHWWSWCAEALESARERDRPILLSIGYSACHWCHVMAHESFEDERTAELMNRWFVNIKVDREERPDLDRIYQLAHQAIARRAGGWPLTMFLAPDDQTPFFGGTYFPPDRRHGMPAFGEILEAVNRAWTEQRTELTDQNQAMRQFLEEVAAVRSEPGEPTLAAVEAGIEALSRQFDRNEGGFSDAPKFPHPSFLDLLAAAMELPSVERGHCQAMLETTLRKMARGGICDQLGGGFCRYSVDGLWMIPHFEKMGYDNAQLLPLYAEAAGTDGQGLMARTALATGEWVMRELQDEKGGYWSSWDADSEGEEGLFYVWDRGEVGQVVGEDAWPLVAAHWGLDRPPNFEGSAWHLHVAKPADELAEELDRDPGEVDRTLDRARQALFQRRSARVHPGCDDKVLASWNGLMIGGMARAGRQLGRDDFIESAARAADFVRETLWNDGRLLATWRAGTAHLDAYLDDHAFLALGLTELLQARWREPDLEFAVDLVEAMLARFEDADHGGFLFTAHDHERLIQRPRPIQDDAIPAGNAYAARALLRLGHLLAETRYLEAAERALRTAWPEVERAPHAHAGLLVAGMDALQPPNQVIVRGNPAGEFEIRRLGRRGTVYRIPEESSLAERYPRQGQATLYHCVGTACSAPLGSWDELEELLDRPEIPATRE